MALEYMPALITFIFLLTIMSYYALIFIKIKKPAKTQKFSSITLIIPAHNEGKYVAGAIESVLDAEFDGNKQIIVVDDGSKDKTYEIASRYKPKVELIKTEHSGKAASLNKALSIAKNDLIAVVDADSIIHKDALELMKDEIERENTVAVTGVVKVKNRRKFICMWIHI